MTQGSLCSSCKRSEQRCVYLTGCCRACTHWVGYDANGNPKAPDVGHAMPIGRVCGTEVGWARHRQTGSMPCDECRHAHRQAKIQRFLGQTA